MIDNKTTRLIILGFIIVLFSACNNKKINSTGSTEWSKLNSWSFNGKMAINDGNNNGSGRVKWLVSNNNTHAQFKAPLGQGSWTILEGTKNAKLTSSTNGESKGETAEQLISYELGWHFPWNKLQYWLRGHQSGSEIKTTTQEIESITDGDWQITYTKWQQTPMGLLPKKIKANKPPYSVKLIIYNWEFE